MKPPASAPPKHPRGLPICAAVTEPAAAAGTQQPPAWRAGEACARKSGVSIVTGIQGLRGSGADAREGGEGVIWTTPDVTAGKELKNDDMESASCAQAVCDIERTRR